MAWTVEDILKVFEESDSDEEEPPLIINEKINQKKKQVDQYLLESLNDIDHNNLPDGQIHFPRKSLWPQQKAECPAGYSSLQSTEMSSYGINDETEETEETTLEQETNGERDKIDIEKPEYTYIAMIMMALHQSPDKRLTRHGIIEFFMKNFPDKCKKKGWEENISNTLAQNKCFIKIPIHFDDLGYGNYWMIDPTCDDRDIVTITSRRTYTRFSDCQIKILKAFFEKNAYPKDEDFDYLTKLLRLPRKVIAVWFQNARQKCRMVTAQASTNLGVQGEVVGVTEWQCDGVTKRDGVTAYSEDTKDKDRD